MRIPLKQYYALLVRYLRPQWPSALFLALVVLATIALQLAGPQLLRAFLDAVQARAASAALLRIALIFLAVALAQQVASLLATYLGENVGWTATNGLRADLAEHCLGLDLTFHNVHTPGEMIERLDGDVSTLAGLFSQFVIQVAGNTLLLLGVLALLLREDWRVGLALTAFALVAFAALLRLRNIAVPHWTAERRASAELFGFLEERLAGSEDIRANGAKPYVMRRFYTLMREQMQRSLRAGLMVNLLMSTLVLLVAVGTAAAFAVGAYLFRSGAASIGTVYLIFRYTTMLEQPLDRISRQLQELQRASAGIARIQELLQTPSRITDSASPTATLPPGALAVAFRGVSFAYHDAPPVANGPAGNGAPILHGLSFHLRPGTVLGLLGRTGSGKTTLTRLLFRLCDPDSGAIYLGVGAKHSGGIGQDPLESMPFSNASPLLVDIRQVPLLKLRRRIGLVTQNVQLFHGSVRDNLTFFDPVVPDERILHVIAELGLEEWLRSLPAGLDTLLETGGSGLSAGQAQILAFTRVFLHDPGLIILDEASSRLDPVTERLTERAVDWLVRTSGRTAIIIAHRLSTVQRADEIMILEEGRICEHGPRALLAADPASRFSRLLRTGLEEVLV